MAWLPVSSTAKHGNCFYFFLAIMHAAPPVATVRRSPLAPLVIQSVGVEHQSDQIRAKKTLY